MTEIDAVDDEKETALVCAVKKQYKEVAIGPWG
jgi:hypothetical protein